MGAIRVTWKHNDKRGKQTYRAIQDLATALNVQYSTAWNYIAKGYKGDSDIRPVGRPPMALTKPNKGSYIKRKALERAMRRNGIKE